MDVDDGWQVKSHKRKGASSLVPLDQPSRAVSPAPGEVLQGSFYPLS